MIAVLYRPNNLFSRTPAEVSKIRAKTVVLSYLSLNISSLPGFIFAALLNIMEKLLSPTVLDFLALAVEGIWSCWARSKLELGRLYGRRLNLSLRTGISVDW